MSDKAETEFLEGRSRHKAKENIQKWGYQSPETLLLAIMEELGELTQAHLQNVWENGHVSNEYNELYDLQALIYQYFYMLEWNRYGKHEFGRYEDFIGIHEYFDDLEEVKNNA